MTSFSIILNSINQFQNLMTRHSDLNSTHLQITHQFSIIPKNDSPILAKLAKKIHNPITKGVSTRWNSTVKMAYSLKGVSGELVPIGSVVSLPPAKFLTSLNNPSLSKGPIGPNLVPGYGALRSWGKSELSGTGPCIGNSLVVCLCGRCLATAWWKELLIRQNVTIIKDPFLTMFDVADDEVVDGSRVLWWVLASFVSFERRLLSGNWRRPQSPASIWSIFVMSVLSTLRLFPPGVPSWMFLADPWRVPSVQGVSDVIFEGKFIRPVVSKSARFQKDC